MTVTVESSRGRCRAGAGPRQPPPWSVGPWTCPPCASFRGHPDGVIARGLGRSYGDAAQCTGGLTIDTAGFGHIGVLDEAAFTIEVGGGVSLHDLMRRLIPAGWFVTVTPEPATSPSEAPSPRTSMERTTIATEASPGTSWR